MPPAASVWLIAGMSSDQTDAATITPEAKPSRIFCIFDALSRPKTSELAEPKTVPVNGIRSTIAICSGVIFYKNKVILCKDTIFRQ